MVKHLRISRWSTIDVDRIRSHEYPADTIFGPLRKSTATITYLTSIITSQYSKTNSHHNACPWILGGVSLNTLPKKRYRIIRKLPVV